MPIQQASILPHSPILIPQIGKENLNLLRNTTKAYLDIEKSLIDKKINTIVIISPHGYINPTNFTLNLHPTYSCNFEEFGDFATKNEWPADIELIQNIREVLNPASKLSLISEKTLDHGCAVPLTLLTKNLPDVKIVPIYYSGLDYKEHLEFGTTLKTILTKSTNSIAVFASGDLAHTISKDAPGGFSPKGKKFDNKLMELLKTKDVDSITSLDTRLVNDAKECGLKSILILLGILNNINYTPKILSYEHPFGIGYMVMNFEIV